MSKLCRPTIMLVLTLVLQIELDDSYGVVNSTCECANQHFRCHHVAAALLFGYVKLPLMN